MTRVDRISRTFAITAKKTRRWVSQHACRGSPAPSEGARARTPCTISNSGPGMPAHACVQRCTAPCRDHTAGRRLGDAPWRSGPRPSARESLRQEIKVDPVADVKPTSLQATFLRRKHPCDTSSQYAMRDVESERLLSPPSPAPHRLHRGHLRERCDSNPEPHPGPSASRCVRSVLFFRTRLPIRCH